jgi:hypothetical protein
VDLVAGVAGAEGAGSAVAGEVGVGGDVAQVGVGEQGLQGCAVGGVVEVADHGDQLFPGGDQAAVDVGGADGLPAAFSVGGCAAAEFALEVIDQHGQLPAAGQRDAVFGQSRLKICPVVSVSSTWLRIPARGKAGLVSSPTSMPRSSLPSITITCG